MRGECRLWQAGLRGLRRGCLFSFLVASPVWAQMPFSGNVSFSLDHFPNAPSSASRALPAAARGATEVRLRLFTDTTLKRGAATFRAAGYVEGLAADRGLGHTSTDAIVRARELYAELGSKAIDVRAGFSRLVWGRLDELQPGDVINPLDLSKFFFEGRTEARLPVLLLRSRWHFREGGSLEGVVLPRFQPGHFDQLDEGSSPFNLVPQATCGPAMLSAVCSEPVIRVEEPDASWRNLQGGARLAATSGRIDWAVSAFRGFEAFPIYHLAMVSEVPVRLVLLGSYPRTSMVAGDFESVLGQWGIRGEVVALVEDTFQSADATRLVEGHSIQSGAGVDRKSGLYRATASVLVDYRAAAHDENVKRHTDVSVIGSAERTFARETRLLRGLGLYNVSEGTAFVRMVGAISLRDNLWLEGSGGLFVGEGDDVVGLFRDRDFLYVKVKYYF